MAKQTVLVTGAASGIVLTTSTSVLRGGTGGAGQGGPAYVASKGAVIALGFPLGRFAAPGEIANAGFYLISEAARFMTDEVMHVNGGSNLG